MYHPHIQIATLSELGTRGQASGTRSFTPAQRPGSPWLLLLSPLLSLQEPGAHRKSGLQAPTQNVPGRDMMNKKTE